MRKELSPLAKYEFVTAQTAAAGLQPREAESPGTIKVEDLFRPGHLERVPSNPVHQVVPHRHAATLLVTGPTLERQRIFQFCQARHGRTQLKKRTHHQNEAEPDGTG